MEENMHSVWLLEATFTRAYVRDILFKKISSSMSIPFREKLGASWWTIRCIHYDIDGHMWVLYLIYLSQNVVPCGY